MSVELSNHRLELRAIKSLLNEELPAGARLRMLASLTKDDFSVPVCQTVYNRVRALVEKTMEIPEYVDILDDPAIPKDQRAALRVSPEAAATNKKQLVTAVNQLHKYRKLRMAYNISLDIVNKLKDSRDLDPDSLLDHIGERIAKSRHSTPSNAKLWHLGKEGNVGKLVKRALYKPQEAMLKTGFTKYDSINGGLPTTGVMILGATTSGGKSVVSQKLVWNLHTINNIDAIRVSLEMSDEQEINRWLSMVTGIPFWKIKQRKLTEREQKACLKAARKLDEHSAKNGARYTWYCPEGDLSIDQLFLTIAPFGFKVVCIDYLGLLEGADGDDQWRALSAMTRKAKVYSKKHNCLVILLVQLDDATDKIRYSKGIREHADVYWHWNYSKPEVRESKILPIRIGKVRDGELFDMPMLDKFETMDVENPPEEKGATRDTYKTDVDLAEEDVGASGDRSVL